jgi:hypothetical protein
MEKLTYSLLLSLIVFTSNAQIDSIYHLKIPQKTFTLNPLNRIDGKYYYGNEKLRSFDALQVPFYVLNDSIVNLHYKKYRIFNTIARVVAYVPLIYFLGVAGNRNFYISNQDTFWAIYFLSIGTTIGFDIAKKIQIKKAAMRYNNALKEPPLGYLELKPDDNSLGLAVMYHF